MVYRYERTMTLIKGCCCWSLMLFLTNGSVIWVYVLYFCHLLKQVMVEFMYLRLEPSCISKRYDTAFDLSFVYKRKRKYPKHDEHKLFWIFSKLSFYLPYSALLILFLASLHVYKCVCVCPKTGQWRRGRCKAVSNISTIKHYSVWDKLMKLL